ncbi:MAG: hypothetical protein ABWZ91_04590 [Nocardioides sp.]
MAQVFLHVGLPKTGTTSIQAALQAAAAELSDAGALFPCGTHHAQRLAAFDLLGQRAPGGRADATAGAFRRMVAEIDAYGGDRVIVSEEELGLARPGQVRRVVRALSGHEVFVVVGVRDLGRTLVSAWQQGILMGDTTRWPDYVEAVRDPARGDIRTGASFRLRHDLLRVLDAWVTHVPVARIRLITAPPAGSHPDVLLARFAAAAALPAAFWDGRATPRNQSPGPAQVEVVRRLNEVITGRLDRQQHRWVLERGVRPGLTAGASRPLLLPREDLAWTRELGQHLIDEIRRRGHPVYGDLDDLLPTEAATSPRRPDDLSEGELLAAAEATLGSVAVVLGSRPRRAKPRTQGEGPRSMEVLASSARAAKFRLAKSALPRARDNRLLAWAVRSYLRRGSTF